MSRRFAAIQAMAALAAMGVGAVPMLDDAPPRPSRGLPPPRPLPEPTGDDLDRKERAKARIQRRNEKRLRAKAWGGWR
jgi:hypothetical protein